MSNNDSQVLRQIVLGAGASSGYPLGSELLGIIKKKVPGYFFITNFPFF
jgi:hypothetical protein